MPRTPDWMDRSFEDESEGDTANDPQLAHDPQVELLSYRPWGSAPPVQTHLPFRRRRESPRARLETTIDDSLNRFADLRHLDEGWNGPGSLPVSTIAWTIAREVLSRIVEGAPEEGPLVLATVRLVPLSSGGVHLVWRRQGWLLTMEIPSDGSASRDFFGKDGGGFVQGNLSNSSQFLDAVGFLRNRLAPV
jgi:hypothetical protein